MPARPPFSVGLLDDLRVGSFDDFPELKAGDTLEALGETLVPQARESGIAHFIDQQLSVPAHESLLQARIFNFRPPYAEFYRAAIVSVDTRTRETVAQSFEVMRLRAWKSWRDN